MKQRDREAWRLELDYVERLKRGLASSSVGEQMDILQQVRQEIEQHLRGAGEPVSLIEMAGALQHLGAPEDLAIERAALHAANRGDRQTAAPQVIDYPTAQVADAPDPAEALPLLKRIWWGSFIAVVGLFVPYINLEVCAIIGSIVVATAIFRSRGDVHQQLYVVGELEWAVAGLLVAMSALGAAATTFPLLALLNFALMIALIACSLTSYWILLTTAARWTTAAGRNDTAADILLRRKIFVMVVFPLLLVAGISLAVTTQDELLTSLLMLPVSWVTGYLFTLAPLSWAIAAIEDAARPRA